MEVGRTRRHAASHLWSQSVLCAQPRRRLAIENLFSFHLLHSEPTLWGGCDARAGGHVRSPAGATARTGEPKKGLLSRHNSAHAKHNHV
eukprot:2458822-Prymnesium_polylepis.1